MNDPLLKALENLQEASVKLLQRSLKEKIRIAMDAICDSIQEAHQEEKGM
ncbi:hypothetical protein GCM10011571_17450 [Marinithermofilum abyssi]|uniref:Uncharacterized protein n=1 Tax=Marinithermofilum abyssi TaxID=1571185 RepID=A0A8J2VHH2_9BACL|nr:hypothetical protein [Marinithermofilum abyssi]GGE16303.1 hypothetical protein GCM10011571_17450 [Marinithermofilum abyssi]